MDTERTSVPAVRPALAAACPALAEGTAADAVAGVVPSFVASPSSTAEVAALLRAAAQAGLAVVPRGAGTGLSWGAPPSRCDLVVDLRSLDQVLEHAAGDLVARVQAGVTIGQLAVALGSAGQQLALDVPAEATVGGVVATGTAGPRRFRYGAPRDLLIGITVVRADGVVARSGGKVVKNVAGYDLGKLFAGSQGTLGVITEVTFRLHPLPAAVAWVTAEFGPAERAGAVAATAAAAGSPLVPSAVELDWPGGSQRPLRVGVLLEGTGPGVAERAKQMSELLAAPGGTVSVAETAPPRWGALPDPVAPRGVRGVVPPGQHSGPGLVLGERAGPGAGRGGRGGRGRRGPARGERPGRGGRAVRLPGPGHAGRRCGAVRDRAAGAGRGRPGVCRSPRRCDRAGRVAGGVRGGRGRGGPGPGPDASRQGSVRPGSPDVPRPRC